MIFGHSAAMLQGDGRHRHFRGLRHLKFGHMLRRAASFFPGSGFAMATDLLGDPKVHKTAHKTSHKSSHKKSHKKSSHHLETAIGLPPIDLSGVAQDIAGGVGLGSVMHAAHEHEHGGGERRHRRVNWANPRALGRAQRRLGSFIHHFTKTARFLGMHVGRAPHRSRKGAFPRRKR